VGIGRRQPGGERQQEAAQSRHPEATSCSGARGWPGLAENRNWTRCAVNLLVRTASSATLKRNIGEAKRSDEWCSSPPGDGRPRCALVLDHGVGISEAFSVDVRACAARPPISRCLREPLLKSD